MYCDRWRVSTVLQLLLMLLGQSPSVAKMVVDGVQHFRQQGRRRCLTWCSSWCRKTQNCVSDFKSSSLRIKRPRQKPNWQSSSVCRYSCFPFLCLSRPRNAVHFVSEDCSSFTRPQDATLKLTPKKASRSPKPKKAGTAAQEFQPEAPQEFQPEAPLPEAMVWLYKCMSSKHSHHPKKHSSSSLFPLLAIFGPPRAWCNNCPSRVCAY